MNFRTVHGVVQAKLLTTIYELFHSYHLISYVKLKAIMVSFDIHNPVFSPIFRATGKSVFQTGKAARLKIVFHPEVEVPS